MKFIHLFNICSALILTTFAKNSQDVGIKSKRDQIQTSEECKYINSLLGEEESYNCCDYPGVICQDGHIILIMTYDSNLSGSIPESIGNLTYLEQINISGNHLSGSIPESIGKLTKLKLLALGNNELSGSIPESIGNLTEVEAITLNNNNLSGSIPESIGKLTLLQQLKLNNNNLSGTIPESFENLTRLDDFDISYNCIDCNGVKIKNFNCAESTMNKDTCDVDYKTNTSEECKYINSLLGEEESYNCCDNPDVICQDGHIILIMTYDSNLSGSIPESIGNLTYLEQINISGNHLSGSIPESIGKLTKLKLLALGNNELSGSIPESIGNLTEVEAITLNNNNLSGSIPESIGKLTLLQQLKLNNNNLSGTIPESFENLTRLDDLTLNNNHLSGTVPESIENLTKLRDLDISNNCIECATTAKEYGSVRITCEEDLTKSEECGVIRCGKIGKKKYGSCPSGLCCSKNGYCGTTSEFCNLSKGCQSKYGKCHKKSKKYYVKKGNSHHKDKHNSHHKDKHNSHHNDKHNSHHNDKHNSYRKHKHN